MPTTSGFVQRLTLLKDSRLACVWLGPSNDDVEIFTIQLAAAGPEATWAHQRAMIAMLAEAQIGCREVEVTHDTGSIAIEAVADSSPSDSVLLVEALEVTQAIQDLAHSIPLLAGKRTVVRVALGVADGGSVTVRGEIAVRKSVDEVPFVIASDNVVVVNPAETGNLPLKREDAARTLNFVLPDATEGPLHVELVAVEDSVSGTPIGFGGPTRAVVWFHASPPMRLRVIGFRYQQDGVSHVPTPRDFAWLRSWVGRAYPAGVLAVTTGMTDATAAVEFGCGDINAQLAAIRVLDMDAGGDERTHYYGLVSDGGFFMRGCAAVPSNPAPDAVGSGPTGPGTWGWDFDGSYGDWYGGHELGHTYGRRHPGFCGETANDLDNYPFADGQLANGNDSFVGFDVGDPANALPMRALPGTQWHDVMTYCNFQWLSAYTYLGIRRRLADEDALGPAGDGGAGPMPGGGRPDARFPGVRAAEAPVARASPTRSRPAATAGRPGRRWRRDLRARRSRWTAGSSAGPMRCACG
jgi:hypothetical protein